MVNLFTVSIPAPASRSRSVSLNNEISFHAPVRLIRCRSTAHPYGLRLCRSAPAGSIPAPASLNCRLQISNCRLGQYGAQSSKSISQLRDLLLRRSLKSVVAEDDPLSLAWRGRFNGIARAEDGEGRRGKKEGEKETEEGGAFHNYYIYLHQACQSVFPLVFSRTAISDGATNR
jgi:hypothetical protein